MKVKKVVYTRSVTINIGNFESVRVEMGAEGEVEPTETFTTAFDRLKSDVDDVVIAETTEIRRRLAAKRAKEEQERSAD